MRAGIGIERERSRESIDNKAKYIFQERLSSNDIYIYIFSIIVSYRIEILREITRSIVERWSVYYRRSLKTFSFFSELQISFNCRYIDQ